MTATRVDERSQTREIKTQTEAAVAFALNQDWRQAVDANVAVLRLGPNNIEALNRLAKALLELGELTEARDVIEVALRIGPANTIARRNRDRLERAEAVTMPTSSEQANGASPSEPVTAVSEAAATYDTQSTVAGPDSPARHVYSGHLLMNETGKSTIATLIDATDRTAVGHLSSGEALPLSREGNRLLLHSCRGEPVGRVHPRLAQRILSLMDAGNRYEAAFLRDHPAEGVQVIIGEVYQHPSQHGRPSFMSSGASGFRGYVRSNHELVDSGLGGPPARNTSEDEEDPPEFEALVRAHDRGELDGRQGPSTDDLN